VRAEVVGQRGSLVDASLIGPINGLGNGANDDLDACAKHDEAQKADLKRQICGLRVTLQAKIEQLYEGTAPDVQRRTFETCR
jgi:hypothetical protein